MKRMFLAIPLIALISCSKQADTTGPAMSKMKVTTEGMGAQISTALADSLSASYRQAIGADNGNDSTLVSVTYDADLLRAQLADPTVKTVRIEMVHTIAHTRNNFGQSTGASGGNTTQIRYLNTAQGTNGVTETGLLCPRADGSPCR